MGQAVSTILYRVELVGRCRLHLKYDGTRAKTRFRLSAERTSPFKSAGGVIEDVLDKL